MTATGGQPPGLVSTARLQEIVTALIDIPSPTGDERPAADYLAGTLTAAGVPGHVQPIDARQANAHGRLPGAGHGPDLMLYAPIDTIAGPTPVCQSTVYDDLVRGHGAGNPKGHAACVVHAMEVLAQSGARLHGDVIAGFGAGGMPTNALPGSDRANTGQGAGCSFLLEQGVFPDLAIIAKPGTGVSYEEVGLAWFEVTVEGTHTYVGSRHLLPYRNANAAAAEVILRLEEWFGGYARRHTDGQVAPQAVVAWVSAGWPNTAAFIPDACRFRVDLRLSPRTTPPEARREFETALAAIAAEVRVRARSEMVLAIPGGHTDPSHPVVRATVDAWSAEHGVPHVWPTGLSGATDANILRGRGVPTARVGMPKVPGITDFAEGMNTVSLAAMARLTRILVRAAFEVCGDDGAKPEDRT